jgi:hypothetical protein
MGPFPQSWPAQGRPATTCARERVSRSSTSRPALRGAERHRHRSDHRVGAAAWRVTHGALRGPADRIGMDLHRPHGGGHDHLRRRRTAARHTSACPTTTLFPGSMPVKPEISRRRRCRAACPRPTARAAGNSAMFPCPAGDGAGTVWSRCRNGKALVRPTAVSQSWATFATFRIRSGDGLPAFLGARSRATRNLLEPQVTLT